MTLKEKALYYLAPNQMMQKWSIEGTLCRNMKLFDKENTYIPNNMMDVILKYKGKINTIKAYLFIIKLFYAEDENGWIKIDEFKQNLQIKTNKTFLKHMQFVLDTGLVFIEEQTKEYIKFNYKKLIDACVTHN